METDAVALLEQNLEHWQQNKFIKVLFEEKAFYDFLEEMAEKENHQLAQAFVMARQDEEPVFQVYNVEISKPYTALTVQITSPEIQERKFATFVYNFEKGQFCRFIIKHDGANIALVEDELYYTIANEQGRICNLWLKKINRDKLLTERDRLLLTEEDPNYQIEGKRLVCVYS